MKRIINVILILTLVLALAACSGANATASEEKGGITLGDSYADALPVSTQLVIGTLKLEDTDLAVEPGQASDLLPLWQAASSLVSSDTAATAEVEAVVKQIQRAMTQEQIKAIADMRLTQEDVTPVLQEAGLGMRQGAEGQLQGDGSARGGDMDLPAMPEGGGAVVRGGGDIGRGGGAMVEGGGFGGGLGMQGMQDMSEDERATAIAERLGGASSGSNPLLFGVLIRLLETRAQQ